MRRACSATTLLSGLLVVVPSAHAGGGLTICVVSPRVLIVDPQPFFCESLTDALAKETAVEVAGWTTDELEAARLATTLSPDVVLAELELRSGSGLALATSLHGRTRVVVLTRRHEGDVILDAAASGASGCLGHDLVPSELPPLIEQAAAGRFVVIAQRLGETLRRAGTAADRPSDGRGDLRRLTIREREVLVLLARGMDNGAIGRHLHLSAHTARTHVGNVLRKLGAHSRAEAAQIALRAGEAEPSVAIHRIEGPELEGR
jgi:DNA-binding NarL/FixJ family response regulator